jgi:hypothetical protein
MSLGFAAFLIAIFSTTIVSLISCAKRPTSIDLFVVLALLVPFVLSNCLYWFPGWHGANADEFMAWAPLFIIPWSLAGALPSVIAVLFIRKWSPGATRRGSD